jgi:ubiquinone/menaquinone biosynthesis C-methylase UbiE
MDSFNSYADPNMAAAYARLEFPNTYYLAFRDIPQIIANHVQGSRAVDFGCGAGRSTRYLWHLGFSCTGVDISKDMIALARKIDPVGDYRLIPDGNLSPLPDENFDLVLSAFAFDNIPTMEKKVALFREIARVLKPSGRMINLVSSPEIYLHEWASFTTKDYPENRLARVGDVVRIINTDIADKRPVEDILWPDETYRETYRQAGLEPVLTLKPLANEKEPYPWVNETRIAPWVIYVLKKTT